MSMASTSNQIDSSYYASSSTPRWNVFLSFRGKDTRKNFTGHLYSALDRSGIRTFMDDPELPRGEEISPQLLKAIQESKVSIVVFSENYASSRWCLDELVKILECRGTTGQLVLPVFYNVRPSVVRNKTNSFAEAFKRHKKRFGTNTEKVEKWEGAVTEAANLSGYDLKKDANGNEAKLVQIIVEKVLLEVNLVCLNVAKEPVGIDSRVKDIIQLLSIDTNGVRRIGIFGMGGVGKTTIAKAVYNEKFNCFYGSCFLANIREASGQPNGLVRVQEQLIFEVLKTRNITIGAADRGISIIQERLHSKKVLIVLDDLDHSEQFNLLVGQRNRFASGSVIIITTRDGCLLDQIKVEDRYMVKELDNNESLELFSRHAFGKAKPLDDFMEISKDIVSYAGGIPLALEVFGSNLFGQTITGWRSFVEKLQHVPNNEIQEKLKISFDALDDDVKDIFLDIACFFIRMYKDDAVTVLGSCYDYVENEINNLVKRCLLTINDKNELRMHDLIRDMGRRIVRKKFPKEPGKQSRLWSCEDICYVLKKDKGTEEIEGIIPDDCDAFNKLLGKVPLNTETFKKMHRLRLLTIEGVHLTGSFEHIFEELRWFSWRRCPLEHFPSDFHPQKLVILDLPDSKIYILWHGILFLEQLKILNLDGCEFLKTTPDFTGVPNLEKLRLSMCRRLAEIHPSIGQLSRLTCLDMRVCEILRRIPNSICNLKALESLTLYSCSVLEELPEELGNIESLTKLVASWSGIFKIPDSIGRLSRLVTLELKSCHKLRTLPNSLCNLRALESLHLGYCNNLKELPEELGNIESLRELNLFYCEKLKNIPSSICKLPLRELSLGDCYHRDNHPFDGDLLDNIGSLSSLELLNLSGNIFSTLPCSLGQLSNLKRLNLRYCWSLRSLTKLPPNLEELDARECTSMERLPNLSNLKHLRLLFLENCSRLVEIQGLDKLNSIQEIHLEGCTNLAITFNEMFFQVYSGFGRQIDIFLPTRDFPDWFGHQIEGTRSGTRSGPTWKYPFNVRTNWFDDHPKYSVNMSTICFDVPQNSENKFLGMILWLVCSGLPEADAVVENKTNGNTWFHHHNSGNHVASSWVSFIPKTQIEVKCGDKIEASIYGPHLIMQRFGVHLVYKTDTKENYYR